MLQGYVGGQSRYGFMVTGAFAPYVVGIFGSSVRLA